MSNTAKPIGRRVFLKRTMGVAALVAGAQLGFIPTAAAYGWSRTLRRGATGDDVRELQIRVAGWAADRGAQDIVTADGAFGPATEAAVKRFQQAYGLVADGIAGPQTQGAFNSLESSDGSTAHFDWSEFVSKDGSGFDGGRVDARVIQENIRRLMYKLEALRKKAGGNAVSITSGFRSVRHNTAVGGTSNSQHMYGIAADVSIRGVAPAKVRELATSCGFSGIIVYRTFVHLDSRVEYPYGAGAWYWP